MDKTRLSEIRQGKQDELLRWHFVVSPVIALEAKPHHEPQLCLANFCMCPLPPSLVRLVEWQDGSSHQLPSPQQVRVLQFQADCEAAGAVLVACSSVLSWHLCCRWRRVPRRTSCVSRELPSTVPATSVQPRVMMQDLSLARQLPLRSPTSLSAHLSHFS